MRCLYFICSACRSEKYFTERIPIIYLLCRTFTAAWISGYDTRTNRWNSLSYNIYRISALDDPLSQRARRTTTPDAISSIQEERISLSEEEIEQVTSHINLLPAWKCLIFILGGMIAIKYGGDFVVVEPLRLQSCLGLSQTLIGLTIIAMGTKPSGTCHFHCCRQKR